MEGNLSKIIGPFIGSLLDDHPDMQGDPQIQGLAGPMPAQLVVVNEEKARLANHVFQDLNYYSTHGNLVLLKDMKQEFFKHPPSGDVVDFTAQFNKFYIKRTNDLTLREKFHCGACEDGGGRNSDGWIDGPFLQDTVLPIFIQRLQSFKSN